MEFAESPERYLGRVVSLTGSLYPVEITCNDICPALACCQGSLALDGVVRLDGLVCDLLPQVLGDNDCVEEFYALHWGPDAQRVGPQPGDFVTMVWTVTSQGSLPWELPGIHVDSLEMRRPSGISGHYSIAVTEVTFEGESCGLPPVVEGDTGHLYLAAVGDAARVYTGAFPCTHGAEYIGEVISQRWFDVRVPVICPDCCCDFVISGDVFGDFMEGQYFYYDGRCSIEAGFVGERVDRELGR